jgi:hypothetical protein
MTNLMLTSRCNLNCDFCFAVDIMGGNTELDVSFKIFQEYIDHLDRSGWSRLDCWVVNQHSIQSFPASWTMHFAG